MKSTNNIQQPRRIIATLLRTAVSLGLLSFLFIQADINKLLQVVSDLSIYLLISIPLLFAINILLSSVRWRAFLKTFGVAEGFFRICLIYFISYFWSNFLPTTVGGDGYRFLEMRKRNPDKSREIFLSILLDRVYGFITLCFVHIISAILFWKIIFQNKTLFLIEMMIFGGMGGAYIAWMVRNRLKNLMRGDFFGKILTRVEDVVSVKNKLTWDVILVASIASLLFVLVTSLGMKIYYLTAGANVDYFFTTYVTTLSNIVSALPFSINGLGLFELPQLLAMGIQGIDTETVIAAAVSARVIGLMISAAGGIAYLIESWLPTITKINS